MSSQLSDLSAEELNFVIGHPAQVHARVVVADLIRALRSCETAEDYNDFQRELFQHVYQCEEHLGAVRRVVKRLRRGGKVPADAPDVPTARDPNHGETWFNEDLTYQRIIRQLRSVGDALAWRVTNFDRRFVLVLSRNAPPGPMAPKDGLPYELGAVEELWNERKHFALLHDLTSCVRIGDLTEFTRDGQRRLVEVKARAQTSPRQTARMQAAIDAINDGAPLPGCDQRLVAVDIDLATHLAQLGDALAIASKEGAVAMKVPGGRALVAANLLTMASSERFENNAHWLPYIERKRQTALHRAGIANASHHMTMQTVDSSARSPVAVPYGVYPIEPADCADLICDFATVEIIMAPDALFQRAVQLGLQPELLLPETHGNLDGDQSMFRLRRGDRAVVVHAAVAGQFLAELINIDTFLRAVAQLLEIDSVPGAPIVTFRNEQRVWR